MKIVTPIITIDGPSCAGKGTLCKSMAELLQWHLLDSGAIYRTLALAAVYNNLDINLEDSLALLAINMNINFISANGNLKIFLEGKDVSNEIRSQEIADVASRIATFSRVRKVLLYRQRNFSRLPGLIADGRDMGTVVFPNALVKIFLHASQEERAYRRMLQLQKRSFSVSFRHLLSEIKERDNRDYNRDIAPLMPAKDALILDSTNLTIRQITEEALKYVHQKLAIYCK